MKLEVGMYARLFGKIGKIVKLCDCEQCEARGYYEPIIEYAHNERDYVNGYWKDNLKASHNIIDLIEVGDVIVDKDGHKYPINYEFETYYNNEYGSCEITIDDNITLFFKDGLSIVTKEQFESISYKIGE